MGFSTASTTPSFTRRPIAVLSRVYKSRMFIFSEKRAPRVLNGLVRIFDLRVGGLMSSLLDMRRAWLARTWKMRPSGEYVLAERS